MSELQALNPERIIRVLAEHQVDYVLVGALAARLQGFPRVTADADITPARDDRNLQRLASALEELNARIYTEAVPEGLAFDRSAAMLARADMWNLVTDAGRIDIIFQPAGTSGYAELDRNAIAYDVFGVELRVASLADIIRSKQASDRPQDRQDVLVMREIQKQSERRND